MTTYSDDEAVPYVDMDMTVKAFPARPGYKHLYTLNDDEVIVSHPNHHPVVYNFVTMTAKALSDFTRVVEETGILDQGRSQKEKSRDE